MTQPGFTFKKLRKDAKLTQWQLGEKIGRSRFMIMKNERGRWPTKDMVRRYEKFFGVELIFVAVHPEDILFVKDKKGTKHVLYKKSLL